MKISLFDKSTVCHICMFKVPLSSSLTKLEHLNLCENCYLLGSVCKNIVQVRTSLGLWAGFGLILTE